MDMILIMDHVSSLHQIMLILQTLDARLGTMESVSNALRTGYLTPKMFVSLFQINAKLQIMLEIAQAATKDMI